MAGDEAMADDAATPSTPLASVTITNPAVIAISPDGHCKRVRYRSGSQSSSASSSCAISSSFVTYPNCHVARYCSRDCLRERCSTDSIRRFCDNVAMAQARVRQIEDHMAHCLKVAAAGRGQQQQHQQQQVHYQQQQHQLFEEKIHLIDALVIMGWEHYQCFLAESESFETAEAAVRHIYEEALDISIQLFCSSPPASSNNSINNDRLMILLLILDFDEYCETLLEYQLTREYVEAQSTAEPNGADRTAGVSSTDTGTAKIAEILNSTTARRGDNYLQQMNELWKSGMFERFDPMANEEEDHFAKIHAAGLCLVLFRKLESQQRDRQQTDLNTMECQFRYLFDEYLPRQLTQPSMNNIIATKYARVLFQDGTPTVYWSLLADSYRKEWGEYFDGSESGEEEPSDMDMYDDDDDDEDDGQ